MRDEGISNLRQMLTPLGFYDAMREERLRRAGGITHWLEAMALTALVIEDKEAALTHLQEWLMTFTMFEATREPHAYELEARDRLRLIRDLLQTEGISAAKAHLDQWQASTVKALRIEDLMA